MYESSGVRDKLNQSDQYYLSHQITGGSSYIEMMILDQIITLGIFSVIQPSMREEVMECEICHPTRDLGQYEYSDGMMKGVDLNTNSKYFDLSTSAAMITIER